MAGFKNTVLTAAQITGGGGLLASNNLSDVAAAATARTNLGAAKTITQVQSRRASDLALPTNGSFSTITSITLTVGTWLVVAQATIINGNATASMAEVDLSMGTALGTFLDGTTTIASTGELPALSGGAALIVVVGTIVVTTGGTVLMSGAAGAVAANTVKATSPNSGNAGATSITALLIA